MPAADIPPIVPLLLLVLIGAIVVLGIAYRRAKRRADRAERMLEGLQASTSAALAGPDSELRNAVDAIALEVERIGEGQRFVTAVLTRQGNLPQQPRSGVDTPRSSS